MLTFNQESFVDQLKTQFLGRHLIYLNEVDSTNSYLKSIPSDSITHGSLCIADAQVQGRGQYKREWLSAGGLNLTWSYLLKPAEYDRLFMLTLAFIYSAAEVIQATTGLETQLKWPNDLIIKEKKVGGVLAETVFNGNHLERCIIGIGINVNQSAFPDDLSQASSLSMLTGASFQREELLANISLRSEQAYEQWLNRDRQLVKHINEKLIGYGEQVAVQLDGVPLEGTKLMLGVNTSGHLHMMDDDYTVHTYAYEQVRVIPNH
jgi:BirA family transcriptional regulator, biotin operon repressor / biotin---[acetyl-CoA-carboxylase] ligase